MKTSIIAEIGVNHNGDVTTAKRLIDEAKSSGATMVKFQIFQSDKLVSKNVSLADYQLKNTNMNTSQYELLKKLELSHSELMQLRDYAIRKNIKFLSTAFDLESLNFLVEKLEVDMLKIPSGEITNGPFIKEHAKFNLPILISTGISTHDEIKEALKIIQITRKNPVASIDDFSKSFRNEANPLLFDNVTLLHCVSEYPAPINEVNLRSIPFLKDKFNLKVGYSDHSDSFIIPAIAVSLGASIIEKHLTLDKRMIGPDHKASMEPDNFRIMIEAIAEVEHSLGKYEKKPQKSELKNKYIVRKFLVASKDIPRGEKFSEDNISSLRTGGGISPMNYWRLIGKISNKSYKKGEIIE